MGGSVPTSMDKEAYFTVTEPSSDETPVVVELPHAGTSIPLPFLACLIAPVRALGRDADLHVDELYADAPLEGATLVVARVSRYVVDLNRSEGDIDAESVAGAKPGARLAHGLIWRLTTDGERCLARPLSRDELRERLDAIHRPYHRALQAIIDRKVSRFGYAVVLAAHSMPSVGRMQYGDRGRARADVVPGTRGRTSADGVFIDCVEAHARASALTVIHDDPYRGGFTTSHYGRPSSGVHAVQVELARRLYMDETTLRPKATEFARTRAWCRELVRALGVTTLR
jgi:N-formylglutamate deformylase